VLASAKQLAAESGLPLMVHIGDVEKRVPASLTSVCLDMLTAGDVLLHIYTPQLGGLLGEDGSVVPGLRDAVGRGVLLDAAPGVYNVSYDVGRALMDKGLLPDIISSDVTSWSLKGPVYGLAATMSRYMALGLSLAQVIQMATAAPARALGLSAGKGSLAVGMDADISVLEVKTGEWEIPDSTGKLLKLEKLLTPLFCVKGGEVIRSNPAGRP
jgi:dihydroorotase